MELVAIEMSRIIYLTKVVRPAGQTYLPDAVTKLLQRYSFAKYPSVDDLSREVSSFGIGKFDDIQIDEFNIYADGVIVAARAPTEKLDAFLADVFSWAEKELGMVQAATARPEKFIESSIVVKSAKDLAFALAPKTEAIEILNSAFANRAADGDPYRLSGFLIDCDPIQYLGRRKPMRFAVERRVNEPYSENIFFSHAPLHTAEHVKLLAKLENLSTRQ